MTDLSTDAIDGAITTCNKGGGDRFTTPARAQLVALKADRDMWRNRSLSVEECISDFFGSAQQARDYPSKHNEQGDTQ